MCVIIYYKFFTSPRGSIWSVASPKKHQAQVPMFFYMMLFNFLRDKNTQIFGASRKGQAAKDLFWPLGQKNIFLG